MKKTLSLLLSFRLLFGISIPAVGENSAAQDEDALQLRRLVLDDRGENGSVRRPYWVDENGNEIARSAPEPRVAAAAALPATYDLRKGGFVTPVKNQSKVGSCWAFSTIACMESSMIRQGFGTADDTDYSEAHLTWFAQRQLTTDTNDPTYGDGFNAENPFDDGLNLFYSTAALMRGSGVQLERYAPWTNPQSAEEAMRDMAQPESDRYVSYGRLYEARWIDEYDYFFSGTESDLFKTAVKTVKQALMQNGNVSMAYYHLDEGWNMEHACHYQNKTAMYLNHAVEIIGWDDGFSRENFNADMRPASDGAWLVKGSWGTDFGNDGYYWLSYSDPSIGQCFTLIAKPKQTYDSIYQYDGSVTFAASYERTVIESANRFHSDKNELLTHVSFRNLNDVTVDATVSVYVAGDDYVPSGNDPTANMMLVESATTKLKDIPCGYFTIELDEPVDVSGQYFTVVVRFLNGHANSRYVAAMLEGTGENKQAKPGQSFIKMDDTWRDTTNIYGKNYHNVSIKAMTQNRPDTVYTLHYEGNGGTGAPVDRTGCGLVTISNVKPKREGYTFLGWAEGIVNTPQYVSGELFNLKTNTTLYAVWKKGNAVDPLAPVVFITNYVTARSEKYFTSVEFHCETKNIPEGAQIVWMVDYSKKQTDTDTFVWYGAKKDYTVQIKVIKDKKILARSDEETIYIKHSFWDRLSGLLRVLFNKPYYVVQ